MRLMWLAAGAAVGYVLGAKAGRERYEQIRATARDWAAKPAVTDAVDSVTTLAGRAKDAVADKTTEVVNRAGETVSDKVDEVTAKIRKTAPKPPPVTPATA